MSFNYAREKRKFDKEWEQLQIEYLAAGMDEKTIAQMKEFDWKWFCSRRAYDNHNQPLPDGEDFSEGGNAILFRKFSSLSAELDLQNISERYDWVQEIEDETVHQRLKSLGNKDLELLTLIAMEGYTQAEVARLWKCSRSAVTQRMKKIRKILGDA
ncbi:MAG: sigma factor-like helix-turn-helix DNA-binding protein [Eubacteriales bacterium]|nr:sigma factor-like helix-turn-helix DNA-binding protein [Eubacteriales bacterium]